MSGGTFWLLALNTGLAALVLVPFLAVLVSIVRDVLSRRAGRRFSWIDVPGIGRLPVLTDEVHSGASCRKA
jgi:hypothetical protein